MGQNARAAVVARSGSEFDDSTVVTLICETTLDILECATERHVIEEFHERVHGNRFGSETPQRRTELRQQMSTGDLVYRHRNARARRLLDFNNVAT